MQKGRVVNLRYFGINEFIRKNYFFIIVFLLFIVGLVFGVFLFDNFERLGSYAPEYLKEFVLDRSNVSFWKILLNSSLSYLTLLSLQFMLGASLFGVVTVAVSVMLKGFFEGGITAHLYSNYALKGIAFNAVIYIPAILVFIIVFLIASKESIKFSLKISSLTLSRTMPFNLAQSFKDYTIKYVIFAVVTLIASIIDAVVSVSLIQHFTI